ncbi:hypothetical protein AMATHDRAFT_67563 [Amanita thiersii Skay4041]|uniref:Uncharacterized protein n=1 Tax=Amanita thiersii Skay4041 TaxID=703135 RepID=A0A2A9NBW0_9AGAR|nr:hypothetical protein AMATHDRAFT_67563 [Amanita thiersii Skay4041]
MTALRKPGLSQELAERITHAERLAPNNKRPSTATSSYDRDYSSSDEGSSGIEPEDVNGVTIYRPKKSPDGSYTVHL